MTTISVCLHNEQARALKALAVAMDRSASAVVRSALEDYIDKHRGKRASQRRRGRIGEHAWEVFDLLTDQ
jgi:predicted transcriptional regulator